jgi:hypothetical protein
MARIAAKPKAARAARGHQLTITRLQAELREARHQGMLRSALIWYEMMPPQLLAPSPGNPVMGYAVVTDVYSDEGLSRLPWRVTHIAATVDHYLVSDVDSHVLHWFRKARTGSGVNAWTGTGAWPVHATPLSAWHEIRRRMQHSYAERLLACDSEIAKIHGVVR